jgi:hypothetical protein
MILRQIWLRSPKTPGASVDEMLQEKPPYTEQVIWVADDARLKPGVHLTLQGDDTEWVLLQIYGRRDHKDINRVWGLDLPKSQRTEV